MSKVTKEYIVKDIRKIVRLRAELNTNKKAIARLDDAKVKIENDLIDAKEQLDKDMKNNKVLRVWMDQQIYVITNPDKIPADVRIETIDIVVNKI